MRAWIVALALASPALADSGQQNPTWWSKFQGMSAVLSRATGPLK
jgi:hypothetical protein